MQLSGRVGLGRSFRTRTRRVRGRQDDAETRLGEIYIVAVDPAHQRSGVGTALTQLALDELADAGMTVAMVETGGDPGYAAARELYEHSGVTLLPIARYSRAL